MTPNEILRKTRRNHDLTLEDMATLLDTSKQRLSQMEGGDTITQERMAAWYNNPTLPEWARTMAFEMMIADVRGKLTEQEARLDAMSANLPHFSKTTPLPMAA